ncbi:conserved oligomeric Golgi complex subunit 3 [Geosmithia morbida]|uniref:Conserved oligomeric Golgi complex subunit 3 n=1 Tax=Geosmithia morbida TaxID=1094350 RepID=A0A9P4YZQ8_9HYPO|nr:conserved oligomeric Golgi complex subunit 3 [Geosmithia morbida]KAF4126038.1 conserved oligomeric Golgi complex subunit 3 [Geosmithia morbida]
MYDESWYSFVEISNSSSKKSAPTNSTNSNQAHRRRESSLLQQPNGANSNVPVEVKTPLENVYEEIENTNTPPEPTLLRRAASYSDFYRVVRAQFPGKKKAVAAKKGQNRQWDALMLFEGPASDNIEDDDWSSTLDHELDRQLLDSAQEEYSLYRDQLILTERHLDGLIDDASSTLDILTTLSNSFKSVEAQTSTFQSQCEGLVNEQKRLEKLADEVGTDLYYYTYLDTATRRLNAPGAGRLVEDHGFGDMVENIDACIIFMAERPNYRDRDTYLARYSALLTKALHLLDHGFTARLDKTMTDIGKQIANTQSESARHALAYGRFEEMMADTYALIPNVRRVVRSAFDQYGRPKEVSSTSSAAAAAHATSIRESYSSAASNMFHTYLTTRDRHLKPMTQHDLDEHAKEVKELSVETASRNLVKQCFERIYSEGKIFTHIFGVEPAWSSVPESAFQIIKAVNTFMPHPGHLSPLGMALQSSLQSAAGGLQTTCAVVGWLASEHSVSEVEEDETPFFRKSKEYAAQLLVWNMWPFADACFDAEITKVITKATVQDTALTVAQSDAYPLVKKAMDLLARFDQAMPKERSAKDSPVVFKIVRETIQVLQKAEARIKSLKNGTDGDLFMVKNLLIIKNELVSLEIGDIRGQPGAGGASSSASGRGAVPSMQHFSQVWDTISPQNWVSFFGGIMAGGTTLWSRGAGAVGGGVTPAVTAKTLTVEDMSEQLDELLRQSIYAFTNRWATLINDSKARKAGVKPIAKVEADLDSLLRAAFASQPEVVAKLKEAIELNAQAQNDAKDGKQGEKKY